MSDIDRDPELDRKPLDSRGTAEGVTGAASGVSEAQDGTTAPAPIEPTGADDRKGDAANRDRPGP